MPSRSEKDPAQTHFVASQIHLALSKARMTIADLAKKIGESEAFIRNLLEGEDGLDRLVNLALLKKIANATGVDMTIKIRADRPVKSRSTVKSGDK